MTARLAGIALACSLCLNPSLRCSVAVYDTCSACRGAGSFKCTSCECHRCNATGIIEGVCPKCNGSAKVTCERCQGAGQILTKKGWFSDTYERCWTCSGSRQQQCGCKAGKISIPCPSCDRGRLAQCPHCGSTGKLNCQTCNGSGKVASEWYRSLAALTIDRLKHEIAKRERQISANRADISDLRERYRQREQDWEEDYAAAQSSRYMRENFESTYYQKGMETLQGEIDGARESMRELQEEITALEMVMESKLT